MTLSGSATTCAEAAPRAVADIGSDAKLSTAQQLEGNFTMTKQAQTSSSIPTMNAMWGINSDSMDSAMKTWSQWLNDWSLAQKESVQFLKDRMSRDIEAATRIAACANPTEVFDLQFRHTCNAVADYITETQKLVALLSRAGVSSFVPQYPSSKPLE
jgi:hypothetical protein